MKYFKKIPYGHQTIDKTDIDSVISALSSDWLTQGPKVREFEDDLARIVTAKYCVAVSSGTAALHLACLAAGIGIGDEVIVPTLSFVASANCALYVGAIPVLCDVDPDNLTIDVEKAEKKITKRTKAIIGVDFAGQSANWEKLRELAQKYKLILIDDAAQSIGSKHKNKPIGSWADLTAFSFHPVKTITTGEGGAVVTNNKNYYEQIVKLRHHGIEKNSARETWQYDVNELGYNFRLTDIQAALGISQLKRLGRFISKRRSLWKRYAQNLKEVEGLKLPKEAVGNFSAWHIYPIQLDPGFIKKGRNAVFRELTQAGIGVQVHYKPIHLLSLYRKLGYKKGDFPVAEKYFENTITIPLYPSLLRKDQDYIIRKVKESLK